jgi:hypothetical protein
MDSLIVSVPDILQYRPMSKNILQDRVEVFVQEAQMVELVQILGDALYYDFITKFDATGDPMYANYQALLNGSTWTTNGYVRKHYGLKPIVVYYALARLVANNQINITSYGVTSKVNPNSEPVSEAALRNQIIELRSIAISYQETTLDFLNDNATTYPLFNYNNEEPKQTSFRIFDI